MADDGGTMRWLAQRLKSLLMLPVALLILFPSIATYLPSLMNVG